MPNSRSWRPLRRKRRLKDRFGSLLGKLRFGAIAYLPTPIFAYWRRGEIKKGASQMPDARKSSSLQVRLQISICSTKSAKSNSRPLTCVKTSMNLWLHSRTSYRLPKTQKPGWG